MEETSDQEETEAKSENLNTIIPEISISMLPKENTMIKKNYSI